MEICKDFYEGNRIWQKTKTVLEICITIQWKYHLDAEHCRKCYDIYAAANRVRKLWEAGADRLSQTIVLGGDFDKLIQKKKGDNRAKT